MLGLSQSQEKTAGADTDAICYVSMGLVLLNDSAPFYERKIPKQFYHHSAGDLAFRAHKTRFLAGSFARNSLKSDGKIGAAAPQPKGP